jgi:TfoX/Sxy family transcriptional regulator of competence genes
MEHGRRDGSSWGANSLKMPKADKEVEVFFRSVLPDDPRIIVKPMFGHAAAFVNGNMFAGTFGKEMFVRLSDEDGSVLMKEKGASGFAPMEGRPMKGYVVIPDSWTATPAKARSWVSKSLAWAGTMPPKKKKA